MPADNRLDSVTQVKSVPTPELPNASAALLSINNRICLSKAYIPTAALPSSMPCDPGPRPQKKGDCQLLPAETTKRLQINPCREFRRLHCKAKFHCLFFDTLPPRLSTDHSYSRLAMQLFRKDRQARHCWVLFNWLTDTAVQPGLRSINQRLWEVSCSCQKNHPRIPVVTTGAGSSLNYCYTTGWA